MSFLNCCSDIEKLCNKRSGEKGLGLYFFIHSRSKPRFILEYREDWGVAAADAGTLIKFCPYCGSELNLSS
jgi:hypothetical protein